MSNLVKDIKAVPIVMDPATHDYCAAAISHVPHLVSAALAKLVKDADTGDYKDYMHLLAAGGFKDTTRIAASSPEMWEQICAANPTAISQLLGEYINSLLQSKNILIPATATTFTNYLKKRAFTGIHFSDRTVPDGSHRIGSKSA